MQELWSLIGTERANLLETDVYVLDSSLRDLVAPRTFPNQKVTACMPLAHELGSLERDIKALQAGLDILTIEKDWQASKRLSGGKPILIVEGMSVSFLSSTLFDVRICLYTDEETSLARRLTRDVAHCNRKEDFVRAMEKERRDQYHAYYEAYQAQADILINQSQNQFVIERNTYF
ncbi:phosphoribulokinase [Streptococcus pneumoniae]